MTETKLYGWTFDRNLWDSRAEATTFSVGVYQWLPKSSGKGLKKSNTIRVLGYVADPQAVYAKAEELCQQLSQANARFGQLPGWVQKQYSVPKPDGLVVQRRSNELTGDEARAIRNGVMKEHLLPAGFVQSHASTYVRRMGELLQMINFQTSMWGGSYTVNLGLHYTFTPPVVQQKRIPWSNLDHLDCAMGERIGFFLPKKLDTWFGFGTDDAILRKEFIYCVEQSLGVFDHYTPKLEELDALLSNPPKLISPFLISYPTVLYASMEIRLGRLDAAEKRLREPVLLEHRENLPRYHQMLRQIRQLRRAERDPIRTAKLLEWLTA